MRGERFLVRRARPEELGEAAALFECVARETLHWLPPEENSVAAFLKQAEDETVFVALAAGHVAGIAALYEPTRFLHSLYVERAWQRRGVGSALLAAASAAGPGALSLKVETRNIQARDFYARKGFIEDGQGTQGSSSWLRMIQH